MPLRERLCLCIAIRWGRWRQQLFAVLAAAAVVIITTVVVIIIKCSTGNNRHVFGQETWD